MAISSYSIARALLKEKYALNAKTTQEALLDSRTCLRYFPGIPMGKVSECLDCLRNIASVKNTKASHFVVNPQVNKEELPGTWRHIQEYAEPPRAKTEPDVQDVYQLLKLDWITSIATDAAKWTHAKWVKHEVSQQVGNAAGDKEQVLHVIFRNVSPKHLGAIGTALQAQTTFVNPVVFDETVTGTFSVYLVKPSTEPDGSGTVEILMGNSKFQLTGFGNLTTPREYSEVNLYGVAKDLAQGIIDAWKALTVTGSYSYPRYDKASHTVDLTLRSRVAGKSFTKLSIITSWDGFTKTYQDVYFGLTETEADLIVLTKPPQAQAWTCNKRYDESDALWTIFVTREFALAVNVAESIVQRGERETVHESEGIHDLTKPVIAAAAAGTNFALSINLDRFLTWNWKKRRRVSKFPFSGEVTWKVWGWYQYVTSQVYSATLGRYWNDHTYVYHLYAEHTKKYFTNETEARAYIHDADGKEYTSETAYNLIDSSGSRVSHEGDYLYAGIKVRNKKSLITTIDYLEPLT